MERPDFFRYDRDQGAQPEGGTAPRKPQVTRLAGHLTLGNRSGLESAPRHMSNPKAAETVIAAALQPENANKDVQYSAWHRIEKDEQGNVKKLAEQRYGHALLHEMDAEQGMSTTQSATPAGQDLVQQTPTAAAQPTIPPQPQLVTPHVLPQQPAILGNQQGVPATAQAQSQPQQDYQTPGSVHQSQQLGYQQQQTPVVLPPQPTTITPDYGAGSFAQTAVNPQMPTQLDPEHQLASGPLTQDPEHMLPAPKKSWFARMLKSPWFWLVVGVGLIIYFV